MFGFAEYIPDLRCTPYLRGRTVRPVCGNIAGDSPESVASTCAQAESAGEVEPEAFPELSSDGWDHFGESGRGRVRLWKRSLEGGRTNAACASNLAPNK